MIATAPTRVRTQLERVLAAPAFAGAKVHRRLLKHLVDNALAGDTTRLKESLLGIEVFDRPADRFDPASDSIVRVESRRLRQRLARYYAEDGRSDALLIDLPKGSYVPRFLLREAAAPQRVAALELAERGDFFLREGHEAAHRRALARFGEAAALDPLLAEAHWGVARAWTALVGINREAPQTGIALAEAAVRRALALDPAHALALALLAQLRHRFHHDWGEAEQLFRRALELAPGSAYVRHTCSFSLMMRGQFTAAEAQLRAARQIDPHYLGLRGHEALLWLYRRDWVQADAALAALLDLSPGNALALSLQAYLCLRRGEGEAALALYRQVETLHPQLSIGGTGAAQALAGLGRHVQAREALAQLRRQWADRYLSPYQLALVSISLGEHGLALQQLAQSVSERDPNAVCLAVDPGLDALREYPGFADLARQVHGDAGSRSRVGAA